jgi:hypothetical protein
MELHPKAKGFTKKQLAASMQRLMDKKRVKLVTEGSQSRQRTRLIIVDQPLFTDYQRRVCCTPL